MKDKIRASIYDVVAINCNACFDVNGENVTDKVVDAITKLFKERMLELIDFNIDVNEMGEYFSRRIGEIVSCKYCMPSDSKQKFLLKEFLEQMEILRAELRNAINTKEER
jgi:Zn-finger protein